MGMMVYSLLWVLLRMYTINRVTRLRLAFLLAQAWDRPAAANPPVHLKLCIGLRGFRAFRTLGFRAWGFRGLGIIIGGLGV